MPLSTVQSYSDVEEIEAAHVAAKAEITPTTRTPLTARVIRVELDHIWLTRVYESAARIRHVALSPTRAFIWFPSRQGPDVTIGGVAMPATAIMRHGLGEQFYECTSGPTHWGGMSMPLEDMAAAGAAVAGCDLMPPCAPLVVSPSPQAMTKFQRLHAEVAALAEHAPHVIANPEAARGLEQSLVVATVGCLAEAQVHQETRAQQCHSTIMRRFRRLLEDNPDRAIYLPEICVAIGVPDRTLRLCCHEHLGMGPTQYLFLRRMHLAHRALCLADPDETTITEVATHFGFWHFGRFSKNYRSLFGGPPSCTLNSKHMACRKTV